jgi:hypothetical protein
MDTKVVTTFKFGTVTVPDGKSGLWTISTFSLDPATDIGLWMANARSMRDDRGMMYVPKGTYRRLAHKEYGCVMSNTPMEIRTNRKVYDNATGRVLINGLGLGMVVEGLLAKPDVTYIRVIEKDEDVIKLVKPHFTDPRVEIIHADAYEYRPAKGERFDYVWHDIWNDLSEDNFPLMAKLNRRYAHYSKNQGTWSRDEVRAMNRRG